MGQDLADHRKETNLKYAGTYAEAVDLEPPSELPARLHSKWLELVTEMVRARVLTQVDLPLVTRLIYYRYQWQKASIDDAVKLEGLIIRLEKQLGLTPIVAEIRKYVGN
jgi:hypothetical protein